jgi:molecular chaperone GrpE
MSSIILSAKLKNMCCTKSVKIAGLNQDGDVEVTEKRRSRLSEVKRLEKALREEHEKSSEYLNRLKYLQADFENYRKRMETKISEVAQLGKEKLIVNLLSVVDELELALRSGGESENKQVLLEGVEMTLKNMYATLEHEGLAKIEAVGKPFDPKLHEVLMKVPTKEHGEGEIIEEVRKGFMFRGKVIRPSIVKIATAEVLTHE